MESDSDALELKQQLRSHASSMGVDSIGVVDVDVLTALVPNGQTPGFISEGMRSVVVIATHLLTGAVALKDVSTQSLNSHLALDEVSEYLYELSEWLEDRGFLGVPVWPEYADQELGPYGAGLMDLKYVGEAAGIGHVGLNLNFLTPDHGSRVYLGALLTDARIEPDRPLEDPICPGMSCGRCAVTCPTAAIPLEVDRDAHVNDYRDLHQGKCSLGATRISLRSLYRIWHELTREESTTDVESVLENRYWQDLWISINSKRGAFAACFECMYVCPYGARDAKKIFAIPYRQQDIPDNRAIHIRSETKHAVKWVGPPAEREAEYDRSRDFDLPRTG